MRERTGRAVGAGCGGEELAAAGRPLSGLRIGLVGTPAMLERLSGPLTDAGARVLRLLTLEVEPLPVPLAGLEGAWLVFTSGNGVRRFFRAMAEAGRDVRTLAGCRFAVIGASTGRVLQRYGIYADLCPEEFTTAALGDALLRNAGPEETLVLLRSAQADNTLGRVLERAGRRVRDIRIYDVRPRREKGAAPEEADFLIFSSAGGVRAFEAAFGPPRTACVCIGGVTAAALAGREGVLTAARPTAESVLETVLEHAAALRGGSPERMRR